MAILYDHEVHIHVDWILDVLGGGGDTGCGKWDNRGEKMWEVGL